MATGITTNEYRKRLAKHAFDENPSYPLAKITHMVFGDGGVDGEGAVVYMDPDQTTLNSVVTTKALRTVDQPDDYSVRGEGVLESEEFVGEEISEAGLLDEEGRLVGFRNFLPKTKDSGEELAIKITLKF